MFSVSVVETKTGAVGLVNDLVAFIMGPLAGPECRMALARGWLILVRALAAIAVLGVSLVVVWWWWLNQLTDPLHSPYEELRFGLIAIMGMLVAIALILGPAVLAGSLAGDKERGALALLLTTRVNSREIVTGRFVGKLTQVGMILLACLPALVWVGGLVGFSLLHLSIAILLPAAVAFGGGGLAVISSTLSRRARDSLLAVYFVDLLMLLAPLSRALGLPSAGIEWLSALNPFVCLDNLVYFEDSTLALESILLWLLIGVGGIVLASWRLRPTALGQTRDERGPRKGHRQLWVPPIQENRPMIWKELFIERVGSLGKFGRWVGTLLVVGLLGGTTTLAGIILWHDVHGDPNFWGGWANAALENSIGSTGMLLCFLIQWGIGLRAGVTISSERERGTWDSLLTSPLNGGEIIVGKVWGSLYALRWLILAAWFAWSVAAGLGVITTIRAGDLISRTLVEGAFMAAVGVRTSLQCNSATRAMSITIGIWLAAFVALGVGAAIIMVTVVLMCNSVLIVGSQLGIAPPPTALWFPLSGPVAWPLAIHSLYLGVTLALIADTRLRFDRLAGRITEGELSIAVDKFIHGQAKSIEEAEAEMAAIRGDAAPVYQDAEEDLSRPT